MSWQHMGVRIEVYENGQFYSIHDDFDVKAATLEEAKSQIEKQIKTGGLAKLDLPVIGILTSGDWGEKPLDGNIAKGILVGINRTQRTLTVEGLPKGYTLASVLPDTPAMAEHLRTYVERRKAMKKLQELHASLQLDKDLGHGRLEMSDYQTKLAALHARYHLVARGDIKP